jgi:putative phage-type endonuclease
MVDCKQLESREEWLEERKNKIGGSDAACILGLNPWKSNVKLWLEKKGEIQAEDISYKPVVKFGIDAEKPIRELFTLDHSMLKVQYFENNYWQNDKYPFAHASLDGWFTDENGHKGILEIKTVNIHDNNDLEWKNRIPIYYYTQCIHYLMVTEFDYVILKARIKYNDDYIAIKHYEIYKKNALKDIELLIKKEQEFYESLKKDKVPNLILPEI